jgi:hypothetical protein
LITGAIVETIPAGTRLYARLLRYRVEEVPRLVSQMLYPLEYPDGDIVVHGLVELQALDDEGRLLAMERSQPTLNPVRLRPTKLLLFRLRR